MKRPHNFTCIVCGKTKYLIPSRMKNNPRYCSHTCRVKDWTGKNNPHWKEGLKEIECSYCGKMFFRKPSHTHKKGNNYCSAKCRTDSSRGAIYPSLRKRVIKNCVICGKKIELRQSHAENGGGTYCSIECRSVGYQETMAGENNPNWRGGKIELIYKQCGEPYFRAPAMVEGSKFCSTSCMAIWRSMNTNPNYGKRSKSGKREDLGGLYVRSSWEANYARYLNWLVSLDEIASWEYEPDEFEFPVKRGSRYYLPDFKLFNNDGSIEYHEVKGYMDKTSATKLKRMAKYYPEIKLILIDKPVYYAIARQVKNLVGNWE